jgi:hypothetical protein
VNIDYGQPLIGLGSRCYLEIYSLFSLRISTERNPDNGNETRGTAAFEESRRGHVTVPALLSSPRSPPLSRQYTISLCLQAIANVVVLENAIDAMTLGPLVLTAMALIPAVL